MFCFIGLNMFRSIFPPPFQNPFPTEGADSFLPTAIPTLIQWLDFSDMSTLYQDNLKTTPISADGNVIGAATDKSGNNNDITQGTTTRKALYKTGIKNGLGVARFDGADDYYDLPLIAQDDFTVLIVLQTSGDGMLFSLSAGNRQIRIGTSGNNVLTSYDGGSDSSGTLAVARSVWAADAWVSDGVSDVTFFQNGNAYFLSGGYTATMSVNTFGRFGNSDVLNILGDIGEVFFFSSELTSQERINMFDYTNTKWALY